MLYRIQTLYILISIFLNFILLTFNNISFNDKFNELFLTKTILKISLYICLLLSIISLVLFKKRNIQILINTINLFNSYINLLVTLYFIHIYEDVKNNINNILFICLLLSYNFFIYIANKHIKKDITIIDSIKRIR